MKAMLKTVTTLLLALLCLGFLTHPVQANETEIKEALEALVDMDPSTRSQGARILGYYASAAEERAVPKLLEALENDPDMGVKKNVVMSLGEMAKVSDRPGRILKPLLSRLDSEDKQLALAVALVLESFPKDPAVKATEQQRLALYRDNFEADETRDLAADCLATSAHPECLTILAEAMKKEPTRSLAVQALVAQKQAEAAPLVLDFAKEALLSEEEEMFNLGLYAASRVTDASPLKEVLKQASQRNGTPGVEAAELLYKMAPGPDNIEPFRRALGSDDEEVQGAAISALFSLQDEDRERLSDSVLAALEKSKNPDLIGPIFRLALSKTPGNPKYLPGLLKKAKHESPMVRLAIAQYIPEFGVQSKLGVETLKMLLKDEEAEIQAHAIAGLYKITGDFSQVEKPLRSLAKNDESFELLLNSYYASSESPLSRAMGQLVWEKAKSGNEKFYRYLASRNSTLTPEEVQFFLQIFDKLEDNARYTVMSRFYNLHAAQPGVVEILKKGLQGEGDSVWTAASTYLTFTGDVEPIRPIISRGLKSGNSTKISMALSTLSQATALVKEFHQDLATILHSKEEYYVRSTAFSVLAYHDPSAPFAAEQALQLLRKDEFKIAANGSELIFKELAKLMTEADKELLAARLIKIHSQPTALFDNSSELQGILKLVGLASSWPTGSLEVLKDIQKNSPDTYARELAGVAVKTVEGDS